MARRTTLAEIRKLAREKLGFDKLRPDQEAVVSQLLQNRDVLAVMPTGGGKSAIYQLAGLVIGGSTIVVSPLIALQADQVLHIEGSDLPPGALLNSHTTATERKQIFEQLAADELEYLLLAPEQLLNEETFAKLREHPPGLFVIDEAHCVSEWGHDFRPDYRRLGKIIDELAGQNGQRPRVLALTATASPTVREDILRQLHMENAAIHLADFDRPNIDLRVDICADVETKDRLLPIRIREIAKELRIEDINACPGIIYVATQKNTELVQQLLRENNLRATAYHGGMNKAERNAHQAEFMLGDVPIIVATSAFGMGVDKADVRWVIHYDVTDSLDNYFQQIGRAGRDGAPAVALLLYREQDLGLQKSLSSPAKLDPDQVADVIDAVRKRDQVHVEELNEQTEISNGKLGRTLQLLEAEGAVDIAVDGTVVPTDHKTDPADLAEEVVEQQQRFRDWRDSRLEQMRGYATSSACRRQILLSYFGQDAPDTCGHCDNCRTGAAKPAADATKQAQSAHQWPISSTVMHRTLGRGIVQGYESGNVIILFERAGKKAISVDFAEKKELIELLASPARE